MSLLEAHTQALDPCPRDWDALVPVWRIEHDVGSLILVCFHGSGDFFLHNVDTEGHSPWREVVVLDDEFRREMGESMVGVVNRTSKAQTRQAASSEAFLPSGEDGCVPSKANTCPKHSCRAHTTCGKRRSIRS
jgi:hypothetical protein